MLFVSSGTQQLAKSIYMSVHITHIRPVCILSGSLHLGVLCSTYSAPHDRVLTRMRPLLASLEYCPGTARAVSLTYQVGQASQAAWRPRSTVHVSCLPDRG